MVHNHIMNVNFLIELKQIEFLKKKFLPCLDFHVINSALDLDTIGYIKFRPNSNKETELHACKIDNINSYKENEREITLRKLKSVFSKVEKTANQIAIFVLQSSFSAFISLALIILLKTDEYNIPTIILLSVTTNLLSIS